MDLNKIASLARLHILPEEYNKLNAQMHQIILQMEQIPPLEELEEPHEELMLRDDVVFPFEDPGLLMQNAPKLEKGCFAVPKAID